MFSTASNVLIMLSYICNQH